MTRVLFVDDEPGVFEGLQRMLRSQRDRWEMVFANGGTAALALLETARFDVVVSDLHMPGMDGATLLKQVRDRFPYVVRIVLTGDLELKTAFRALDVAHQLLVKPCDPEGLRVAVERACSLKSTLDSNLLRRTVTAMGELPTLPRTYGALARAINDPEVSLDRMAKIVESDVAVSAKVLRLVNSAFFGLMNEIATVKTAVCYLGIEVLKHLVLAVEVFGVFKVPKPIAGFSMEKLQNHAQLTARIVKGLPVPRYLSDAAVVAALLHDVGKLVLAARLPEQLAQALRIASHEGQPLYAVEDKLLGFSHAGIGAHLLALWGLPSPIVEAVAYHHAPSLIPQQRFDTVAAVYLANVLAHECDHGQPSSDASPLLQETDLPYLDALDVTPHLPAWQAMAREAADALTA
jgi:HD-like signal output (HDOD) protein